MTTASELPNRQPLSTLPLKGLDGQDLGAEILENRLVLVVNVASECGYTPQYKNLQTLHADFAAKGFSVLGVPCNQFGAQEPGSAEEIQAFCQNNYGVTFPILQKQDVNGDGRSTLYSYLTDSSVGAKKDIKWNFEKFLVRQDGKVVARFASEIEADDPDLVSKVEKYLA